MIWLAALCGAPGPAAAATTERVVVDRHTGLAIDGFDPVAYFTDRGPRQGQSEFEAARNGAIWRFCNEGNRRIFIARPEVYAPQFGGYDPVGVARGVPLQGHPLVWLVDRQRLYLFGSEDNRAAFAADPDGYRDAARLQWPVLLPSLAE